MSRPSISLKARALRYLAAREHSRVELTRKLAPYVQEGEDLAAVLDALEAANYLSAERFSESLINRRAARYGNGRILAELQSHGVEAQALQDIRTRLNEDEVLRARQLWQKKFGSMPETPQERARQMRFLLQRGFSSQTISQVLRGGWDEWEE